MILSEDEAATKWCPMIRMGVNLEGIVEPNCVGSGCMMWRWYEVPPEVPNRNNMKGYFGYCGLAGEPVDRTKETETGEINVK